MAVTQILELPRPAEWHIVHPPHHRNSPHHLVSHPTDSASLLKATGDRLAKHANDCLKLRIDTLSIAKNTATLAVELRGIGEPLHDRLTRIEGSENSSFKIGKVEAILLADDNLAAQAGRASKAALKFDDVGLREIVLQVPAQPIARVAETTRAQRASGRRRAKWTVAVADGTPETEQRCSSGSRLSCPIALGVSSQRRHEMALGATENLGLRRSHLALAADGRLGLRRRGTASGSRPTLNAGGNLGHGNASNTPNSRRN